MKTLEEKIKERLEKVDYHQSILSREVEDLIWDLKSFLFEKSDNVYYEKSILQINNEVLYHRRVKK